MGFSNAGPDVRTILVRGAHTAAQGKETGRVLRADRDCGDAAVLRLGAQVPRQDGGFSKAPVSGVCFFKLGAGQKDSVRQNDHVANLLEVFDQETFARQLSDILRAVEAEVGVRLAPAIGEGMRVRIKSGPLQGIEGWVEQRYGLTTVLLRLDFINQAAAVKLAADELELV